MTDMTVRLRLIRHGRSRAPEGVFVGSTDVELEPGARKSLLRLRPVLDAHRGPVYVSPMRRTRQTLEELVSGRPAVQVLKDDRIREIDFGRWEMCSFAEIVRRDPGLMADWSEYVDFVFPGGEAVADFTARVGDFLAMVQSGPEREVVAITHGGVIRTMICLALGLPLRHYLLFDVQPGTMTELKLYSRGGILTGLNL
ncbi:histidine phosphatase family protein [Desulfolithobacter sp.]